MGHPALGATSLIAAYRKKLKQQRSQCRALLNHLEHSKKTSQIEANYTSFRLQELFRTVLEAIGLLKALVTVVFETDQQDFDYLEVFDLNYFNSDLGRGLQDFLKEHKLISESKAGLDTVRVVGGGVTRRAVGLAGDLQNQANYQKKDEQVLETDDATVDVLFEQDEAEHQEKELIGE